MWSTVPNKKPVEPLAGTPTKHTHSGKSSPRTQSSQSTRSSSPTREELMIMFPERRLLDHPIVISSMSLCPARIRLEIISDFPNSVVCVRPAFEYDCTLMDILVDNLQAKPAQPTDSIQIPQKWAMNTLYQSLYQQQQERIMNVMDEHRSKWTKKVTEIEKTEASHRPTDDLLEGIDCGSSELVQSLKTNTAWKKDLEWLYPQITSPPPPQLLWWHAEKVRAVFKTQLKSVESCIAVKTSHFQGARKASLLMIYLPDTVRTLSQPLNTFDCEPIHKPIDQDTFFSRVSLLLPTQTTRHYTSEAPMPNQEKSVVENCFDSLKMDKDGQNGKSIPFALTTDTTRSNGELSVTVNTGDDNDPKANGRQTGRSVTPDRSLNIIGGLFRVNQNQIDKDGMIRLSVHECTQTFSDRLVDSNEEMKFHRRNNFNCRGRQLASLLPPLAVHFDEPDVNRDSS
ncbi:hypothetical protein BLNAU_20793 [Blattamonas nauphoetae]|uniref:Uncharacterized protein n=1 Tax=Blattamonas nauphoetae TaxID=2049346 RepID=A0ABQ9WXQ2_9EUKA|nr:hypothetical protein BLNAU_20793 [Blattamonas nauphoetae]